MEAARLGHAEVLTLLLTSGASADLINFEGRTALYLAVNRQQLQTVKVLLAFDCNADLGNANGQTPLMLGVKLVLVDMTKLLLQASPKSVRAIDKEGDSMLSIAAYNGQLEIVRLLLDFDIALSSGGASTPLMLAASNGHMEILKLLLDKGADVGERTWNGHTALTFAAESGQVEAVQALLKRKAQVNSHGSDPAPLACAVQRGHAEVVKLLLKHNADVNANDTDGDPALHEAVYSESTECARVLIHSKSSVSIALDKQNNSQWTPLMAAAQRDLVEIVALLLQNKASTHTRTRDGRSALHIAAEEGKVDVVCLLLQHGAQVNAITKANWTPLMLAAYRGHRETVKILVECGSSLTWKNKEDQNAATVAMLNSRTDILDLLRTEDPEVTNSNSKRRRTH
ncbi:hypothetical protein V7S43_007297 [Phytophthora oleae]|uniref:Uncharacterized protein n=1 Tax=Phytophthora oleae TaxID=2107226 RepID=A0ABD3FRY7_9STRA